MSSAHRHKWLRQAGALVEFVEVTPAMKAAGVERALELSRESDLSYLVSAIYMAMEYERLDFHLASLAASAMMESR